MPKTANHATTIEASTVSDQQLEAVTAGSAPSSTAGLMQVLQQILAQLTSGTTTRPTT